MLPWLCTSGDSRVKEPSTMGETTAKTLSSLKREDWDIWKRPPLQRVQIISHNGDQECNAILWKRLVIGDKLVTSKDE
jgi:hypothetical protein